MTDIRFSLPRWLEKYQQRYQTSLSLEQQMDFVIEASRLNVEYQTGGPFAAGIFEIESGKLVALGVNLVPIENLSMLHAEMVAISLAQRLRGSYNLNQADQPALSLVTSCEPCAMCFGAVPWSGVRQLVTGASGDDARQIGFDEGHKPDDWISVLNQRGINVISGINRPQAVAVLSAYFRQGGDIYNSGEAGC